MNHVPPENEFVNAWEKRESLPEVPPRQKIYAAVVCFLCSLGLPMCLWSGLPTVALELIPLGLLALLCGYVAMTARTPFPIALLLCTAFLAVAMGFSFSGGAVVLSLIVGIAAGAFLFTVTGAAYLTVICPVAGFAVAWAITQNLGLSALALTFLPAALLLAFATLKAKGRTSSICFATGGLLLSLVIFLLIFLRTECGSLGREAVVAYLDGVRGDIVQMLISLRNELLELAQNTAADTQTESLYQQIATTYSDEALTDMVAQMFNLLPGVAVMLCSVLAYEAQLFLNSAHVTAGLGAAVTRESRILTVSVPASVIYVVAFFLMIFVPSSSMASAVIQNITLILMPGLCIVGGHSLMASFTRAKGGMRSFLLIFLVAMICCYTSGVLYILAMCGSYATVMGAIRKKLMEHMQNNGGGNDPSSGSDE